MTRTLVQRIHNPRGYVCACDPDCWCRRTTLGRAVKWWFPGRYFGLHHKNRALEEWSEVMTLGRSPSGSGVNKNGNPSLKESDRAGVRDALPPAAGGRAS